MILIEKIYVPRTIFFSLGGTFIWVHPFILPQLHKLAFFYSQSLYSLYSPLYAQVLHSRIQSTADKNVWRKKKYQRVSESKT